jgi:hypothetical protein
MSIAVGDCGQAVGIFTHIRRRCASLRSLALVSSPKEANMIGERVAWGLI